MDSFKKFDLIVLGGGPGGYPAAIKAAQHGKKVALIEAKELGGTCLNRGCIPTKTLIATAEVLHVIHSADQFGITTGQVSFDYLKMANRKNSVVENLRGSLTNLIAANGITLFQGFGKFVGPKEIKVTGKDNALLTSDQIIIATGSEPKNIAAFPFDGKCIHDSTSLLEITSLPKSIVIIGGGVIGCEFASLFNTLGVQVAVVELLPRLLPMECESLSKALSKIYKKAGITVHTGASVKNIEKGAKGVVAQLATGETLEAEMALVAIGRSLNTDKIGLEKAAIALNKDGTIAVNNRMETSASGIYAVGDIASKWLLAHVATHQGLVAAENVCGIKATMDYRAIPSVIFTAPEIATVGMTAAMAKEKKIDCAAVAYPFQALGKAQASLQTEGFAQIVIDKKTKQILGAQVIGHDASNLIAEMGLAVANEFTLEALIETIHAHPTLSEVWLEAALLANETPLHFAPKKIR